jgi:DNA modification methylase
MTDDMAEVLAGGRQWAVDCADSAEWLSSLPAGSVHCAMTSPPYMGLRDYKTGTWEGGDAACPHAMPSRKQNMDKLGERLGSGGGHSSSTEAASSHCYRDLCGRCGARRVDRQIGLEATVDAYLARLLAVFDGVKRVLRDDGLLCVNMGDSFSSSGPRGRTKTGLRLRDFGVAYGNQVEAEQAIEEATRDRDNTGGQSPGNLLGVPWRFALAMQAAGWCWRSTVVWRKLAPMPASLSGWRWERCRVKVGGRAPRATGKKGSTTNGMPHGAQKGGVFVSRSEWADCPGCDRCAPHDGLVLRRGSWRPTPSWEPVFLFSKSMGYYGDGEPVKTPAASADRPKPTPEMKLVRPNDTDWHDNRYARGPSGYGVSDAGANLRDYWDMPDILEVSSEPLSESHYAAYPTRLVARFLAFACSQRGVCATCGAPWARVVDGTFIPQQDVSLERGRMGLNKPHDESRKDQGRQRGATMYTTLGWRPTCPHADAAVVPSLVLDPFTGSGSTGVAARQLGLRFVGCDLSEKYVAIAKRRIAGALRQSKRVKPGTQPSLFDEVES